eukprot:1160920-Pelagomonas_calceolata.AAC.3
MKAGDWAWMHPKAHASGGFALTVCMPTSPLLVVAQPCPPASPSINTKQYVCLCVRGCVYVSVCAPYMVMCKQALCRNPAVHCCNRARRMERHATLAGMQTAKTRSDSILVRRAPAAWTALPPARRASCHTGC